MIRESPYKSARTLTDDIRDPLRLLAWTFGALAALFATLFASLLFLKPDIERSLYGSLPGRHMPDAFNHLNESISVFVAFTTANFVLLSIATFKKQYALIATLAAGPMFGILGWLVFENFEDPNWSHFFGLSTIGMWVSCAASLSLSLLRRRPTTPTDAANTYRSLSDSE